RRLAPAAVVVDAPEATEGYLNALRKEAGTLLVSLDHVAQAALPSRLIVNPLLGPGKESYEFGPGAQLLLGTRYALVRPEIRRIRPIRAQEPAQPFRVLVALGDDDPNDQAGALAKLLLNCPRVARVDVAIRSHHAGLPALQALAEASAERLEVAVEPG